MVIVSDSLPKNIQFLQEEELKAYLKSSDEICFEQDTLISGYIRILRLSNQYIVQETTDKKQILLHSFSSLEQAKHLVAERLNIYEKMWNGCGCKVDYLR